MGNVLRMILGLPRKQNTIKPIIKPVDEPIKIDCPITYSNIIEMYFIKNDFYYEFDLIGSPDMFGKVDSVGQVRYYVANDSRLLSLIDFLSDNFHVNKKDNYIQVWKKTVKK